MVCSTTVFYETAPEPVNRAQHKRRRHPYLPYILYLPYSDWSTGIVRPPPQVAEWTRRKLCVDQCSFSTLRSILLLRQQVLYRTFGTLDCATQAESSSRLPPGHHPHAYSANPALAELTRPTEKAAKDGRLCRLERSCDSDPGDPIVSTHHHLVRRGFGG